MSDDEHGCFYKITKAQKSARHSLRLDQKHAEHGSDGILGGSERQGRGVYTVESSSFPCGINAQLPFPKDEETDKGRASKSQKHWLDSAVP